MDNKTRQKTRQKHFCEICHYRCNKYSDMQKHFKTIKHLDNMDNKNSPELAIEKCHLLSSNLFANVVKNICIEADYVNINKNVIM